MDQHKSTWSRSDSAMRESLRYWKLPVQAIRHYMQSAGDKKNTQPLYRVPVLLITIDAPEASHLPGNESYEILFKSSGIQWARLIYPPPPSGGSSTGNPSPTTTPGQSCVQWEVINYTNPHYRDVQNVHVWRQPNAASEWGYYLGSYLIGLNTMPANKVEAVRRIYNVVSAEMPSPLSFWTQTGRGAWEDKWERWKYVKIDPSIGRMDVGDMEQCRLDCDPELVSTITAYAQSAAT